MRPRSTSSLSANPMTRTPLALALSLGITACREPTESVSAWSPDGTGVGLDGGDVSSWGDDASSDEAPAVDASSDGASDDTNDDDAPPDDPGTDTTGGVPIDCTPAWSDPWIGSPCSSDVDCAYDGGFCLREDDGFPCGTCSLPCDSLCPDIDDAPETFCVDGTDVGLTGTGYCLSQCDASFTGDDGCRDGYACNVLARVDGTDISDVCIPDAFDSGEDLVGEIDHAFLIAHFGGDPTVNALDFVDDIDGLQLYLDEVGVQHVTAPDLVEPYNEAAAAMCGLVYLLPEQGEWEKAAALALFTDVLTELVGEPIFLRNWWRPPCYNDAVGGAADGDHPDGDAIDLDFSSPATRAIAEGFLCETYWNQDIVAPQQILPGSGLDPRLNMSVGLGNITIHLGVLSGGGRRFWYYDSYTSQPGDGDCW